MIKDFKINDILIAVNSIFKITRKKDNMINTEINLNNKKNILLLTVR